MSDTDGKIVWFEVAADKGDRARVFYGSLFGWSFQPFGDEGDYAMTDGGAVYTNPDGKGIIVYLARPTWRRQSPESRSSAAARASRMRSRAAADTRSAPTQRATRSGSTKPELGGCAEGGIVEAMSIAGRTPSAVHRFRWLIWPAAALPGLAIAYMVARALAPSSASTPPDVIQTWPAEARPAPAFALHDEQGRPLTLASLRGRPAIVTFIDPLCRDFCPREASVLSEAATAIGTDAPAIVSVSVNPWANTARNFREDALHWNLAKGWRWGVGSEAELAKVWRDYAVGVQIPQKTIAGVKVRNITHTGAAYLIDADGYERALFLYPFTTAQVVSAARAMLNT